MSLEQFEQIKNQLADLIKQWDEDAELHKNDENYNENEIDEKYIERYLSIQNYLLSYDLSDIPFEAWEDFVILSDENHNTDFSKTRANIDFDLIDFGSYGNFRGCNVRNLATLGRTLNTNYFDEEIIKANPSLFLSDIFSEEFKGKYYDRILTIKDLASLSNQQLDEIKKINLKSHMYYEEYNGLLLETLGLDRVVELYKYSSEEYDAVNGLIKMYDGYYGFGFKKGKYAPSPEEFLKKIKTVEISELKSVCFDFARKQVTNTESTIEIEKYPEMFIKENPDIFLVDVNIPDEVKERYFKRDLELQDLIDYHDELKNIPVDYFMEDKTAIHRFIRDNYGMGKFQELLEKHLDIFAHIAQRNDANLFAKYLREGKDLDSDFCSAVKDYFLNDDMPGDFRIVSQGQVIFNAPAWLSSMNFKFVDKLNTAKELLEYTDSVFVLDEAQRKVLETFNIENIKRFEQETGFFTHKGYKSSQDLEMLNLFAGYFRSYGPSSLAEKGIDFKNGSLTYEEFLNQLANCLDNMRKNNVFTDFPNYDWLQGEFRDRHPEIFVDINAPEDLKDAFYKNRITSEFLLQHQDYMPYLIDKNILNIKLSVPSLIDKQGRITTMDVDFINEYVSRYGNEKLLQLVSKYGVALSDITITSLHDEIENEQAIEKSLRNSIYNKIIKEKMNYSYLSSVSDFVSDYPEIFVNFDNLINISQEERERLTNAFYSRTLSLYDIKKYPELVDILKDKNLFIAFGNKDSDLELLEMFGNEKFLQLCAKYGRYMYGIAQHLNKDITNRTGKYLDFYATGSLDGLSVDDISQRIEDIIVRECKLGNIAYYPDDAPSFLRKREPELFLEEDAPEKLKEFFYNYKNLAPMSFKVLQRHKEWLPFLKGKALTTSLLRGSHRKKELMQYLELFGEEKGIKLGINRAETVLEMLASDQVDLMKGWYDKTGGKFIPDFVVMKNFNIDDADKFLVSCSNWSNLMRIQSFSKNPKVRDVMLKLAYSFGAFDQDKRGVKKLQDLLTGLPRNISADYSNIMENISSLKSVEPTSSNVNDVPQGYIEYRKLGEALEKEGFPLDPQKELFSQIYRKNTDGTYSLKINPQSYPKSSQLIRSIMEMYPDSPLLTPDVARKFLCGFKLEYDPDFREFFLNNYDTIISDSKYLSKISAIQWQFNKIKTVYSNVNLTLDLAISYIDLYSDRYENVNTGNEKVAEVAALQNYSQEDFEKLQTIYNYGKQRTFSSIPRVESESGISLPTGEYYYEMLRLDDPRAMSIGFESDCCQRLGERAEVCMEHSMVDKNGRVFIITNKNGEVVAQSWVWRNKDVLCFDNIEVPDRKMWSNGIPKGEEDSGIRNQFTDDVLSIYKMVASELLAEDEKIFRNLLEDGKITQEQYDGLRLGKITIGLGYSNIKGSFETLLLDKGIISKPLPFEEPVKLSNNFYVDDSSTQYILEERDDRKEFDGETLPVHSDTYVEYDDSNFSEKSLLLLEKLEIITKGNSRNLEISTNNYVNTEHLVTKIARNYDLNPETTRIVMNSNFAIIYDVNGNKLRVSDLLFNTHVDNGTQQMDIENQVAMQMRLALDQIASDKEIDISALDEKQKEMYTKVIGFTDEMDIERGVSHAR